MELVEKDGFANLTVGGAFYLPLVDDLGAMTAATKKLSPESQALIVRDAGFEAPDGLDVDRLYYSAASIVQNAWYVATKGKVPDNIMEGHNQRMQRHLQAVKEIGTTRKSPTTSDGDLPQLPPDVTIAFHAKKDAQGVYEITIPSVKDPAAEHSINFYLHRPGGHAKTIEEFREQKDLALYHTVLHAAGYKIPVEAPLEAVYPVAAGVVQRWWHLAANQFGVLVKDGIDRTPTILPDEYERDQRLRYQRCLRSVEPPPEKAKKVRPEKVVKEPKPAKESKAPTEKTSRAPKRSEALVFKVKTPTDGLKAAMGQVYAAVVACGETAPLDKVIEAAVAAGFTTKEPAGPAPRIRWLALELVKKGILEVVA